MKITASLSFSPSQDKMVATEDSLYQTFAVLD